MVKSVRKRVSKDFDNLMTGFKSHVSNKRGLNLSFSEVTDIVAKSLNGCSEKDKRKKKSKLFGDFDEFIKS